MEQLLSDAHDRDGRPRILLLADLKRLQDWTELTAELTTRDTAGFALFLATDEPPDDAAFDRLVRWSIPHGIFSASFWGPLCEIAHDTFDEIEVILHIDSDATPDDQPCVMTTWHADESLEEALEFFWECTMVDEGKVYGPRRIVLTVSTDGRLAERVRTWATTMGKSTNPVCPACSGTGLDPRQTRHIRPHRYTTGGHDESAPCPTCGGSGEASGTDEDR